MSNVSLIDVIRIPAIRAYPQVYRTRTKDDLRKYKEFDFLACGKLVEKGILENFIGDYSWKDDIAGADAIFLKKNEVTPQISTTDGGREFNNPERATDFNKNTYAYFTLYSDIPQSDVSGEDSLTIDTGAKDKYLLLIGVRTRFTTEINGTLYVGEGDYTGNVTTEVSLSNDGSTYNTIASDTASFDENFGEQVAGVLLIYFGEFRYAKVKWGFSISVTTAPSHKKSVYGELIEIHVIKGE